MVEVRKRETAYIVNIQDIITGEYITMEGWDPNYVKTPIGLEVSRVNVLGTVLEKQNKTINFDDGTGIISCRTFEPFTPFENINVGDLVIIVARVRQFNEEVYLLPETCKKVKKEWFDYRIKEIEKVKELYREEKIKQERKKISISIEEVKDVKEEEIKETLTEKILNYIESEDKGDGIEKDKIFQIFKDENTSKIFEKILNDGDIFEVKQNMFKVLK